MQNSCNKLKTLIVAVIIVLGGITATGAEAPGGTISGTVKSSDGQPAAFVNVSLVEINRGTISGEQGEYILKNIKDGQYTVKVSFVGLKEQRQIVTVRSGKMTVADFVVKEDAMQLKEIIITAVKRSSNEIPVNAGKANIKPMDLPQSIAIIDNQVLTQQQSLRMSDVLKNANGVYIMGSTGGTQEEIAGRGFAFGSNNTFKNGSRFNNGVMPEISSLESVEILKGSNAILFGNVGAGGILNLVTKKPKFQNGGEIAFRTGSYNFYKPSLDVYGAVNNSEKLAYRLNGTYENAGSFRKNVSSERFYVNPSLLYKINNKTQLLVEADYLNDSRKPDFGIGAINYEIAAVPRTQFIGASWARYNVDQLSSTATLTHNINKTWQLKAMASAQSYNLDQFSTSRPTNIQADGTWNRGLQRSTIGEDYYLGQLDLTGEVLTGKIKHSLLVGADIDKYNTRTNAYSFVFDPANPKSTTYDVVNIFNFDQSAQRTDIPASSITTVNTNPVNRAGVYAQDLISLTDNFKLLAGLRYSYMETRNNVLTKATNTNVEGKPKYDDALTPRLGIVYQPLKTMALFASYANSFNLNTGIDNTGSALSPSMLNQYEAGVKNDFLNGALSANLTVYKIINSDQAQVILPGSPEYNPAFPTAQELAGEVTSKGVELDLSSRAYKGFSFMAGYSYNDTRYTESTIYEVGSKLRYNPAHTANASVFYAFNNGKLRGFDLGLGALYFGDRYAGRSTRLNVQNDAYKLMALPAFTTLDASAGYQYKKFAFRAKVSNLTDKLSYNAHDDNSINPIAPRQFFTTISYKF
ncbi:TonB-dependent receptor [Flavihumibacter sp. R14]|nr:TonB-dependent receptor [Flavihumibacter soli]